MPRGTPDYNNTNSQVSIAVTDNNDIVAAAIGHARIDGRGKIAWRDDFNSGLNRWIRSSSGVGVKAYYDTSSENQLGLYPPIALDPVGLNGQSIAQTFVNIAGTKRIGIECGIKLALNVGNFQLQITGVYADGIEKIGRVKINNTTFKTYIESTSGDVLIATPPDPSLLWDRWIYVKAVIDVETGKWVRLIVGADEYNLGSYALIGASSFPKGQIKVLFWSLAASAILCEPIRLSHAIITIDEP